MRRVIVTRDEDRQPSYFRVSLAVFAIDKRYRAGPREVSEKLVIN